MFIRVLTSVIGLPLVIGLMIVGGPVLHLAACIVAIIGVYEYYKTIQKKYKPLVYVGLGATIAYFIFFQYFFNNFLIFMSLFLMLLFSVMVISYPKYTIIDIVMTLFGPVYVAGLLSFILGIRAMEHGSFLVGLVFISAWGSDTCAYFAGRYLGKHKLAPILSPKKTVEGSVGGAIGAGILAYGYILLLATNERFFMREYALIIILIVGAAAFLSQIGDLSASAIKRFMEQKDFGNLFPGHGGVLDRFDSILMVAPFIYIMLNILGQIINYT